MMPGDRRPCSEQRLRGAVVPAPVLVLVLVALPVAVTAPCCNARARQCAAVLFACMPRFCAVTRCNFAPWYGASDRGLVTSLIIQESSASNNASWPDCLNVCAAQRSVPPLAPHAGRGIGTGTYGFCPDARACAPGSRRRVSSRRGSQSPCSSISTRAANVRSHAHARGALPAAQHRVRRCGRALELKRHTAAKSTPPHPTPVPRLAGCGRSGAVRRCRATARSAAQRSTGEGRYVKVRRESCRSKSREDG
jgi:hypothetical protein